MIVHEPVYFTEDEVTVESNHASDDWMFELDKTLISKDNVDLANDDSTTAQMINSYPPRIVCRFTPISQDIQRTLCTLTLRGLSTHETLLKPVNFTLPLNSSVPTSQCPRPLGVVPGVNPGPPVAVVPGVNPQPPVAEPVVNPQPPVAEPVVHPQPPVAVPVVNPQTPVAEPVVNPQPPVAEPVVNPQPPVAEPVVHPQPPVAVPVVNPQTPVAEPVVNPQPPVAEPVVNPQPPVAVPVVNRQPPVAVGVANPLRGPANIAPAGACRSSTLTDFQNYFNLTDEQVDRPMEEIDLYYLGGLFGPWRYYTGVPGLGLTAGEQHDIHADPNLTSNQMRMKEALKIWQRRNPLTATFRNLLSIVLQLNDGKVANDISGYISYI